MKYLDFVKETTVDGIGIRMSIYISGCKHACNGCHNPETWNFERGKEVTDEVVDNFIEIYKEDPLLNGLTISGGDPLETGNAKDLLAVLKRFKKEGINVWVYTGYTLEQLQKMPEQRECLKYIDVLVDGPFILDLRDVDLRFRGSRNQRVIDVEKIRQGIPVQNSLLIQ